MLLAAASDAGARPTDGADDPQGIGYETTVVETECTSKPDSQSQLHSLCVHWVETTDDAPPLADLDTNDLPDQVDSTLAALDEVWQAEVVDLGYKAPLADDGPQEDQGPDDGTDIYLADVGADGLFGYCAADPFEKKPKKAPAYCVLDDDYALAQFPAEPGPSGLEALQVSLAHEFFHAIQFAYEYSNGERFLSEGTATWIEDQVYDDVDANYRYLEESPLHQPEISLDAFQPSTDAQDFEYGAWTFWRFLSEIYDPDIVRLSWQKGAPTRRENPTAIESVEAATKGREPGGPCLLKSSCSVMSFPGLFAEFAAWSGSYPDSFEEGTAYSQELVGSTPVDGTFELDSDHGSTGKRTIKVDHLSVRRIELDLSGAPTGDRAKVSVDLPKRSHDPQAFVTAIDGASTYKSIKLNEDGEGALVASEADTVVLTLVNASTKHDGETYKYSAVTQP